MNKKLNIAIDGHSSCGKSTIAKFISKFFHLTYVDTGAMYRAITLYCIQNNYIINDIVDVDKLRNMIKDIEVNFEYNAKKGVSVTYLNGINVEDEIRTIEVSDNVSFVAKIPFVRKKLVALQKKIGQKMNVVMDGRDIGTKVFPNAEIKFFITADETIRAKRRWNQLKELNPEISLIQILENLKLRDKNDSNRSINPLRIAKDSIIVDNTEMSIEQQNLFVVSEINKLKNK